MPSAEPIKSRSNPLVKRFRSLKDKSDGDLCLIEGAKLLEEALAAGVTLVEVAASTRAAAAPKIGALLARAAATGAPVRTLAGDIAASLSDAETTSGVLALAKRPAFDARALFRGTPFLLVAVGIQNPGNLGGLLRTAEAAGATGAILTGGTADPCSWKALRGSMGSAFRLPHARIKDVATALRTLRESRIRAIAAVAEGGVPYAEADLRGPIALVLGSEGQGLASAVTQAADARVTIPLAAPVESLNVGVAGALLLFEAARQRR